MTPTDTTTRSASPDLLRRGLAALALSVAVNALLLAATTGTGAVEPFRPLAYPPVIALTAIGAVGATAVYGLIRRRRARPDRDFAVVAEVVLVLSWVPDVTVVPAMAGANTAGVAVLMAMHATTAALSYVVLTR